MWVRTSVAGERVILGKRASSVFWLVTVTDDSGRVGMLRAAIRAGSSQRTAYSSVRVDDGAWHHVVVLFDRDSTISFFVDGAPAGSTAVTSTGSVSNSGDFQLAKLSGYTHFSGDLDEVALYRSLLPAGRIQAHFAAR
jgi:hypothetical protein